MTFPPKAKVYFSKTSSGPGDFYWVQQLKQQAELKTRPLIPAASAHGGVAREQERIHLGASAASLTGGPGPPRDLSKGFRIARERSPSEAFSDADPQNLLSPSKSPCDILTSLCVWRLWHEGMGSELGCQGVLRIAGTSWKAQGKRRRSATNPHNARSEELTILPRSTTQTRLGLGRSAPNHQFMRVVPHGSILGPPEALS